MKVKLLCLVLLLGFSFQSRAVPVVSLEPCQQAVGLFDTVCVDLMISDLGDLGDDDDILTGFDIDVTYDDFILAFDSFVFGTDLDIFGFGSIQDVFDDGAGTVNVFELSFDFDEDLMDFQPNDFLLGTFVFTGINFGTSALDFGFTLLGGGTDLDFNTIELMADFQGASITVPEPGTLFLLMSGLLAMGMHRRRKAIRA